MSNDIGELTSRQKATQKLLYDTEREAAQQITKTQKRAQAEIAGEEAKLKRLHDEYEKLTDVERIRQEESLIKAKNNGYANIRELQRGQAKQESALRTQGDDQLEKLDAHYRETVYRENQRTDNAIREIQAKNATLQNYDKNKSDEQTQALLKDHAVRLQQLQDNQITALTQLQASGEQRYENVRANTELATRTAEQNFKDGYERTLALQNQAIYRNQALASSELEALRAQNARSLAAYSERAADPFYQIIGIGGQLQENENEFKITARIPTHEQGHVSVTVQGNELLITGRRQNSETLESETGQKQTTSSFQSYSETHKLGYPVDTKGIRREFNGDQLVITIPKSTTYSTPAFKQKGVPVERIQALRPKFPENLPQTNAIEPEANGVEAIKRARRGDKPLGTS